MFDTFTKTANYNYRAKNEWKNRTFMDYKDVIRILKEERLIK